VQCAGFLYIALYALNIFAFDYKFGFPEILLGLIQILSWQQKLAPNKEIYRKRPAKYLTHFKSFN